MTALREAIREWLEKLVGTPKPVPVRVPVDRR